MAVLNGATSRTLSVKINVSQLSTPEADPNTASVQKGSIVTLRTGVAGATVFYTLDGSTPDENSLIYSSGIIINDNVTLKAVAMKDGYANSQEFTRNYTAAPSQVPEDSVIVSLGSVKTAAGDTASVPVYVFTDGSRITNMRISVAFDSGSFDNAVTVTPADGVDPSSLFAIRWCRYGCAVYAHVIISIMYLFYFTIEIPEGLSCGIMSQDEGNIHLL